MLELINVVKEFENSSFAAKDISFHLPKGYIMGLIGENGAGKRSLPSEGLPVTCRLV